jgi:membrane protein implicated in regulation of membrane protease activity
MLIVFFLAAFASGALAFWLMWSHGLLVALIATAVVASVTVAVFAVLAAVLRSRTATADEPRSRGVFGILGPRQPR